MYPKVKVRDQDEFLLPLVDDFESLSKNDSFSPVTEYQDNSPPVTIRIPESYIPITVMPIVSDLKGTKKNDNKKVYEDERPNIREDERPNIREDERPNIRASTIPRPRAVLSSPDNDGVIGNKNNLKAKRSSALKNHKLVQNRHVQCTIIPSYTITESATTKTRRKSKEAADKKSDFKAKQGPALAV